MRVVVAVVGGSARRLVTSTVGMYLLVTSTVGRYGRVVMPVFMVMVMVVTMVVVTVTMVVVVVVVAVGVLMAIRVGAFACHMAYRGTPIRLRLLP
ncbi:hypothetical protein ACFTZK_04265 [Streptomyces decoyicus]|uniref:hypothetical protein n=1 Tax=Streptomyces decoyicus TaxID=249567 RepID=UPI00362E8FD9